MQVYCNLLEYCTAYFIWWLKSGEAEAFPASPSPTGLMCVCACVCTWGGGGGMGNLHGIMDFHVAMYIYHIAIHAVIAS